jgi:hypothetical protein
MNGNTRGCQLLNGGINIKVVGQLPHPTIEQFMNVWLESHVRKWEQGKGGGGERGCEWAHV